MKTASILAAVLLLAIVPPAIAGHHGKGSRPAKGSHLVVRQTTPPKDTGDVVGGARDEENVAPYVPH